MKKDNLPKVVKKSIFSKIKIWFKKLIGKDVEKVENSIENVKIMNNNKINFINNIKIEENKGIINVQKMLKEKKIEISDLNDIELQQMIELYRNQIKHKKIELKQYRKKLQNNI